MVCLQEKLQGAIFCQTGRSLSELWTCGVSCPPRVHAVGDNAPIILNAVSAEWSDWSKSSKKVARKAVTIPLILLLVVAMPTVLVMIQPDFLSLLGLSPVIFFFWWREVFLSLDLQTGSVCIFTRTEEVVCLVICLLVSQLVCWFISKMTQNWWRAYHETLMEDRSSVF